VKMNDCIKSCRIQYIGVERSMVVALGGGTLG
jgi:hypothetical protein